MSDASNDTTMPAKESEKNVPTAANAVEEEGAKTPELPATTSLRQRCDGPYICDCSLWYVPFPFPLAHAGLAAVLPSMLHPAPLRRR
jgi:hypothetical protein